MCGPCAKMRPVGGNTLSFAAISTAAMPLSKDFVGMRHHLDKEKKEALSCSNADPFPACLPTMFKITLVDLLTCPGETDSFHGVASQMGYVQRRTMSNRGRKKRRGAWHSNFR